jgi:hypothetical protein
MYREGKPVHNRATSRLDGGNLARGLGAPGICLYPRCNPAYLEKARVAAHPWKIWLPGPDSNQRPSG